MQGARRRERQRHDDRPDQVFARSGAARSTRARWPAPYIAYKGITGPLEPVNEGSFRALKVEIQEGNIMMAHFPAPMARLEPRAADAWSTRSCTRSRRRCPRRIPAAHLGTLGGSFAFFGHDPGRERSFVLQTIEGGGWGGRPYEDGESASVSVCQGDVRNSPIETIELKTPVLVEQRALRHGLRRRREVSRRPRHDDADDATCSKAAGA